MESFNCIRRVDKLGRIVLPKEVRSFYHLEEGSRLELVATSEGITLKKVCLVKNSEMLKAFIKTFYEEFNKPILVINEGIVVSASNKVQKYVSKEINDKKSLKTSLNGEFFTSFKLFDDFACDVTVYKLDITGDDFGCFVVLDKLSEDEELVCNMFVKMFRQQD